MRTTIAVSLAALAIAAGRCGFVETKQRQDIAPGAAWGADAAADAGPRPPDAAPADPLILTTAHAGWKKQLCLSCHGQSASYPHADAGYAPPVCVSCHGYNGAMHRDHATKANSACKECHGAIAHTAAFNAPDDCVVCHNHPASP